MSIFRTILVSFVALAVAMLPLAGGFGLANAATGVSLGAAPADCCPEGQPCEKPMHDCGSLAGCMLKCAGVSGAVMAPFTMALTVSATERPPFALQRLLAPSQNPALPPPRV
ncbi:MAG: hypothetical protein MUO37_09870 [Methyloceanibacter sp.]|jgi:hypothetical protein|nr:hypothetical protein [Methyloceanibacter sp.]